MPYLGIANEEMINYREYLDKRIADCSKLTESIIKSQSRGTS